jgi:hypothetical protein
LRDQLLEVLVLNDADRAVRHRRYSDFIVRFRQHMLVKITEVARILKCVYLPGAVLKPLIQAGDPVNQHRRMSRRPAGSDNVLAATGARSDLDAIQNGIQFRVASHAQTSAFLDQWTKGLSPRSVQQADHVQPPSSPHRAKSARSASPLVHRIVETSIPDSGRH